MTAAAEPDDALCDETVEARAARHLRLLRRLTEMGMDFAEAVHGQAMAPTGEGEPPADKAELALVFSRISRAVRQTVGLEARLAEGASLARRQRAEAEREDQLRDAWRERKIDIHRVVSQAIDAAPEDRFQVAAAHRRLSQTLDAFEVEDVERLLDRPLGAMVARICHDLELDPDWELWADEDWALAEVEARAPASPFVSYYPPGGPQDLPEDLIGARAEAGAPPGREPPGGPAARASPGPAPS